MKREQVLKFFQDGWLRAYGKQFGKRLKSREGCSFCKIKQIERRMFRAMTRYREYMRGSFDKDHGDEVKA